MTIKDTSNTPTSPTDAERQMGEEGGIDPESLQELNRELHEIREAATIVMSGVESEPWERVSLDELINLFYINYKASKGENSENETEIKIWGGVTDPKEHNPTKFRYLVHAFNPYARFTQKSADSSFRELLSGAYKIDTSEGDQSINLFNQPERLGERVSLSMSLIDQEHITTWGEGGIIVEAHIENIVITSPTDSGSHSSSKDFLKRQAQNQLQLSGEALLQLTSGVTYNEVLAFAKSESGETLRLKGFFIKVDKRGQPTDEVIAEKMKQHAERLNLPLVEIQVQGLYEQEMFIIGENGVWAHYNGNRYNLSKDNPQFAFSAFDDKCHIFFPSPQEIENVIIHFIERGNLDQAQAQQIKEGYKVADSQRKSPKVEYDPETKEISRVTVKGGYGKSEIEYWLNSSGYCWRVDMEKYRKILGQIGLGSQSISTEDYDGNLRYQTSLSGSEVLYILESRIDTMEPEEYEKLLGFFRGLKDKIDQVYDREQTLRPGNRYYYLEIQS